MSAAMRRVTRTESARMRTMAPPASSTPTTNNTNNNEVVREAQRTSQLEDEQEHEAKFQANMKALLEDKLQTLRGKVQDIEADNWKYDRKDEFNPNVSQQW